MDKSTRRSFMRRLAGIFIAPIAAIPIVREGVSYSVTFSSGLPPESTTRVRKITEATIGQYADYVSMQWDCGNGYLDIPGSKKMGRIR